MGAVRQFPARSQDTEIVDGRAMPSGVEQGASLGAAASPTDGSASPLATPATGRHDPHNGCHDRSRKSARIGPSPSSGDGPTALYRPCLGAFASARRTAPGANRSGSRRRGNACAQAGRAAPVERRRSASPEDRNGVTLSRGRRRGARRPCRRPRFAGRRWRTTPFLDRATPTRPHPPWRTSPRDARRPSTQGGEIAMDAMPDRSPEFSPPADHADRAHARGTYWSDRNARFPNVPTSRPTNLKS